MHGFAFVLQTLYPVNHLRNIALDRAPCEYVVLVDADFVPSADLYSSLLEFIHSNHSQIEAEKSTVCWDFCSYDIFQLLYFHNYNNIPTIRWKDKYFKNKEICPKILHYPYCSYWPYKLNNRSTFRLKIGLIKNVMKPLANSMLFTFNGWNIDIYTTYTVEMVQSRK